MWAVRQWPASSTQCFRHHAVSLDEFSQRNRASSNDAARHSFRPRFPGRLLFRLARGGGETEPRARCAVAVVSGRRCAVAAAGVNYCRANLARVKASDIRNFLIVSHYQFTSTTWRIFSACKKVELYLGRVAVLSVLRWQCNTGPRVNRLGATEWLESCNSSYFVRQMTPLKIYGHSYCIRPCSI
jgi:hypothetical protein